jgi:ubiquinone/menaquinone biosynthesis C-methylase UbiE
MQEHQCPVQPPSISQGEECMPETNQYDPSPQAQEREQQRLVQQRFGATAQAYARSAVHSQGPDLEWITQAAALTGKELVVDVATGTGFTAFALAPYAREVMGIDITLPMLEAAQRLATERQVTNVHFQQGDALALPFSSSSVDLVTCRHAAHHFSKIAQAVQETVRVLKPGGKLILADSISPEEPELDVFLNEIEVLRDPSHIRNYRISEWLTLLSSAGLTANVLREWSIPLDVRSWTQRMQTPPEDVERIVQRCAHASPLAQERFHIEHHEGFFSFLLPAALLVGVKSTSLSSDSSGPS